MMNFPKLFLALFLAGLCRGFLLKGEYTDIWGHHVKITPHTKHPTFTQCLQNCARPFLPEYNTEEKKPFMARCVKNCMKLQYLCKNFNKCENLYGG